MIKKITSLVLVVCFAFLCGCTSKQEEVKPLNVGVGKITGNFNPFYATEDGDISVIDQVFDKLQRRAADNKLVNLAGSISYEYVGETQVKYTVTVRDDLYFSNGNKVTIDDVIFFYYFISDATYDGIYSDFYLNDIVGLKEYYYDDPDYEDNKLNFELFDDNTALSDYISKNYDDGIDVTSISGIKRIDDYTCTILYNSKNINAVSELNAVIVSKSFYNENYVKGNADKVKSFTDQSMGCGPYYIKSYDSAEKAVNLKANSYFDAAPAFEDVNMLQCDEDAAVKMIKSGALDICSFNAQGNIEASFSSDNLRSFVTNDDEYISVNINSNKITDVETRKQLLSVIDPYDYIEKELGSCYSRLYRPISIRFDEYPSNQQAYFNSNSNETPLKDLINNINLYCCSSDSFVTGLADTIKSDLSMYGISCTITECDYNKLESAVESGKADMWIIANPDGPTCDKYEYYNSNGSLNLTGISDETIDSLTTKIRSSVGYEDRSQSVSSLLEFVMAQAVELPICQRQIITVYNTNRFTKESLNNISDCDGFDYALRLLY